MKRFILSIVMFAFVVISGSSTISAHEERFGRQGALWSPASGAELLERYAKDLELDNSTMAKAKTILANYDKQKERGFKAKKEAIKELHEHLDRGKISEGFLTFDVDHVQDAQESLLSIHERELREISNILSPSQKAVYFLTVNQDRVETIISLKTRRDR